MGKQVLKHADGTAVTAQEAYDSFMNTRVIVASGGVAKEVVDMEWYDNNSEQTDTANVGYVRFGLVHKVSNNLALSLVEAGDSSLVPTGQG